MVAKIGLDSSPGETVLDTDELIDQHIFPARKRLRNLAASTRKSETIVS